MRDAYDLHTHTKASDGLLSPRELVMLGNRRLAGMAVTDHDSTAGLDEAMAAGAELGFPVIPGLEFTTDYGAHEIHILGYFIDHRHPELAACLERVVAGRLERARGIVDRLRGLGYPLSWEMVRAQAPGPYIGRPHVLRALVASGLVSKHESDRFFQDYLAVGRPAFLPHQEIDAKEAIRLTLAAGGVPVLAHPGRVGSESMLAELVGEGLGGLEVYYPRHEPGDVVHFSRMAARFNLVVTGGSDYHGEPDGVDLGRASVPFSSVEALALRAAGGAGRAFLSGLHKMANGGG